MKFQRNPVHGFTSKTNGLVRELKNDIFVSEAHKPEAGVAEPARKQFVCIWDTGATNTVITKTVVDGLISSQAVVPLSGRWGRQATLTNMK